MSAATIEFCLDMLFLGYLALLQLWYLLLNLFALCKLSANNEAHALQEALPELMRALPPLTILMPAYNEYPHIADGVRAALGLDYGAYELIVINDGSRDQTLQLLIDEFDLQPVSDSGQGRLASQPVRGVYQSKAIANLRVIDKINGGKPDALNAGLNFARNPYVLVTDADSVLEPDCLLNAMRPFLQSAQTVESGGALRILNDCTVENGRLTAVRLARSPVALFQTLEYLRAYLWSRMGLTALNGVTVVSGAFYLARRQALLDAGGLYLTVAEDTEITMRLHAWYGARHTPYRISYTADSACYTDVPASWRVFAKQRISWQRGLWEAILHNRGLFGQRTFMGLVSFPLLIVFECLGPLIEAAAYLYLLWAVLAGVLSLRSLIAFLALGVGLGALVSASALYMEVRSRPVYREFRQLAVLAALSLIENLGFRQYSSCLRLIGTCDWLGRALRGRTPDPRP